MTNTMKNKLPVWYWLVSGVALVLALANLSAFLKLFTHYLAISDEARALGLLPVWSLCVFALASMAGVFGCAGLLFKKKWAVKVFVVYLIAMTVQQIYLAGFSIASDYIPGPIGVVLVPILAISLLLWFTHSAASKNWLT